MLDPELEKMTENKEEHHGKRKSLGRGLGALLGDDDLDIADLSLDNHENKTEQPHKKNTQNVNINSVVPSKYQPRTEFDKEAIDALAASIKEKGVLQPLLVRRSGDKYEIIAGERRWRASKIAGLTEIPVIEKDLNDQEVLEVALVENLLRENLSAIEEAEGFQRLIDEFSHTQEALSQIVGKSRSHIANTLRLLNLPDSVKNLIKEGKLSAGHARALIGLENAETLAAEIVKKDLSVRQVEDLVARQKENKEKEKPAKTKDADLEAIEKDLNLELGLRIKISPSKQGGGKVTLQYASVAELDMIIDILEQKRKNKNLSASQEEIASPTAGNEKFSIKVIE